MKKLFRKVLIAFIVSTVFATQVWAADSFVVRDIKVKGLHRIRYGTVLSYLPVRVGQQFDEENSANLIRALYSTGFFQNVALQRQGNTLIIKVIERPTIGDIKVSGNKDIPTKKLKEVFKTLGLVQGQVFDRSVLEQVQQQLKASYNNQGKYNARVETSVKSLPQNRVAIKIDISEGTVAKITEIKIIGNDTFTSSQLLKQFKLTTPGLLTFYTKTDQYSKEKLDASLEALHSFYMDHGYIKFRVESAQVSMTPDHKHVYITIKIKEGPQFRVKGFRLTGKFVLPEVDLKKLVTIEPGEVFSRKKVSDSVSALGDALGNHGYAFPQIKANPQVDENNNLIFISFHIDPGHRVYVRHIVFDGNFKTADNVLRRAMRQNEGAMLSLKHVKESERQLHLLTYLSNVQVKTVPVPGTNNQVDLVFHVNENPSATASAAIGYGTNGPEFNASLNQDNFLGTGNFVGLGFQADKFARSFNFSYFNPYYTPSGIGRGFNVYYTNTTPGRQGITNYSTDSYGGNVNYDIPVTDVNHLQFGVGYQNLTLKHGKAPATGLSTQFTNFLAANGTVFRQARVIGGWSSNTYDQLPFPTKGVNSHTNVLLALPGGRGGLSYYKLDYTSHLFIPIYNGFLFTASANLGYGDSLGHNKAAKGGLPFYENFFAGGIGTTGQVRGFDSYSLGPKDSTGAPIGGNAMYSGSVGLVFPNFIGHGSIRTSAFVDAGNVYYYGPAAFGGVGGGPIRFSTGLAVEWHSPFGPLEFSLGFPLNRKPGDDVENFQFTIGTNI